MPPFAESQEQDPIIMAGYDDDNSSITDDIRFFHKPKQHGNTNDNHDVTTKKETSKVVLSFYDVLMDFNLCCSALHDDETVVTGSRSKTSYEQVAYSLPNENGNKIQEEENKEEVLYGISSKQEYSPKRNNRKLNLSNKMPPFAECNNNNTMEYEKKKKKFSIMNRINKSTSMKKVNSSQSTTSTNLSSSNQKEKRTNMTGQIKESMSLKKIKSIGKTMSTASVTTNNNNKKKKKTASVMMTNGTFSFKKTNRNRNRKTNESQDANNVGLSSFVKQMNRMGYRSVTKQNHSYYEIRTKTTQ